VVTKPEITWKLLDRYFKDEVTLRERRVIEQWLNEAGSEDIRWFFKELRDDPEVRQIQAEVWARFQRGDVLTVGAGQRDIQRKTASAVRSISWHSRGVLKAAAVVALVLGGSLVVWQRVQILPEHHTDAALRAIIAPVGRPPVPMSLPDGSQVILSPGSTLRYATAFDADRRDVRLEGEAYFAVTHDTRRPFVVRAGELVAEDLGTEFVVRAYPEDRYGRVVVREGQVRVGSTIVGPGQLGRLTTGGALVVESVDMVSWFAWTRGRLNLDGTSLRDALPKLSRWYDLEFRLADSSLESRKLGGDFPAQLRHDALEQTMTALGLYMTRKERVVTFHARPVTPS
jgi:ferric-dicitrate binding protein FerR (iron transport regulator)